MAYTPRQFADKLNHCLDDMDAPKGDRERAGILSKLIGIPRHISHSLLQGHKMPEDELIERLAIEFDVETQYLCGRKIKKGEVSA